MGHSVAVVPTSSLRQDSTDFSRDSRDSREQEQYFPSWNAEGNKKKNNRERYNKTGRRKTMDDHLSSSYKTMPRSVAASQRYHDKRSNNATNYNANYHVNINNYWNRHSEGRTRPRKDFFDVPSSGNTRHNQQQQQNRHQNRTTYKHHHRHFARGMTSNVHHPSRIWYITDPSFYEYYEPGTDLEDKPSVHSHVRLNDMIKYNINDEKRGRHVGRTSLRRHHLAGKLSPLDLCASELQHIFSKVKSHFMYYGFLDTCSFWRFHDCVLCAGSVDASTAIPHLRK